jgi:small subunit ribosomal protein S20
MPQHKSSIKRVRQEKRRNLRNRLHKQEMKTLIKKIKQLVSENADKTEIDGAYKAVVQKLDRMAVKGYIKKNNASNKKSKITKLVNQASA